MKNFIEFIRTQGVVGLAVGFILGGAVSALVASIVTDLINPLIGLAIGNLGNLNALVLHIGRTNITYGRFISVALNFAIVAAVVYFGVTWLKLDKLDKKKE
ncbi:MAG: MscL family protein [bacterium]